MASQTVESKGGDASTKTVRYTLDGTTPTPSSPSYQPGKPLVLDDLAQGKGSVNVTAGVFNADNVLAGAPKTFVWKVVA